MKRKNPYLFRAKGVQNASELITGILSALVSSSEETIFGTEFVEPLAMSVGGAVKSVAEGVDAEIHDDANKKLFAIAIKSGPAVFNSSSKKRQITNLNRAGKIAQQQEVAYYPVIGYCYGKKSKKPSIVFELAGQDFWAALTGEDDFYLKIIEFMDKKPEEYVEKFKDSYGRAHNRLVQQFVTLFCRSDGAIDWNRLVQFVSGRD